jgi:lipopolysaccharide transport system ATP-binding protein
MSESILTFKNVGVRYRADKHIWTRNYFDALKDISFELYPGDSLGIIGRNGSGKSTLLRLIGDIIRPDWGNITRRPMKTVLLALQVGFDMELSGRDNAVFSGMLLGFDHDEVQEKMDYIIEFSGLGEFIDQPVKTYSTGMRSRLGFSIAIELDADILLVDEVLGVGDAEFQKKSTAAMKEKILSDQTVVLVSHHAGIIKQLCNRALWIENGETRETGDVDSVIAAYQQGL